MTNTNINLQPVTEDVSRYQTQTLWAEEINFRADSGYDMSTIFRRAQASLNRCFKQGDRPRAELGWDGNGFPPFNPSNRIRITVEVLPEPAAQTSAIEASKGQEGTSVKPAGK